METIKTESAGDISVYVQGKVTDNETVVLTVHDLGVNRNFFRITFSDNEFLDFLNSDDMSLMASKCNWIHVIIPGQGDNEQDISAGDKYPSMDNLAKGIGEICDNLGVKGVVLLGDGAGANICARICILREDLINGAILINCTASTPTFVESLKDKIVGYKLDSSEISARAEAFLLVHRFGKVKESDGEHELRHIMNNYKEYLRKSINPRNLNLYIQSFMNRNSILEKAEQIQCPILIICGEASNTAGQTKVFHAALCNAASDDSVRKSKIELIQVDQVANVIRERPEKVAEYILYFIQGLGLASGIVTRRMSTMQQPIFNGSSMIEMDQPKGPENLLFQSDRKYSCVNDTNGDIKRFLAQHKETA